MTFASPMMLWSLLALVPLVAVYFLKVRPRTRSTTAYFLWEQIFHEKRSTALWHRLRNLLSLLLMALAFAALAFAMAEPRWGDRDRRDLLILIDNSASMQTKEGLKTRLDLALDQARGIARAMDGVQRAAVATVAGQLRYQSHLSDNPRELIAAIDQIKPTYESFRTAALPEAPVSDAVDQPEADAEPTEAAASQEDWSNRRRVVLITDGVLSGSSAPDGIEVLSVGTRQDNLGLVAADLQFVPGDNDRMSFYYQLGSTHEKPVEAELELYREDDAGKQHLAKVIPLDVAPGLNPPEVMSVEGAQPGRWVARLSNDDPLPADNTAWLVARRPPPIAVSVVAQNGYFLQRSVQAFSGRAGSLKLVAENPDIVLAQGVSPGESDNSRGIAFLPQGESVWWGTAGEEFTVGAPRVVVEDHPLLRHLDPLSINFLGARTITAPPGSEVLVAADNGVPLIYLASRSSAKTVVVNLDPVAAEFYYSAWFPVLVHASAMHLAGRESPLAATYAPGDSVALPLGPGVTGMDVTPPGGESTHIDGPRLDQLQQPGFYQLHSGPRDWTIACTPISSGETLLNAEKEFEKPQRLASGGPPSGWLAILALVVVTTESLLYHRRKVG